MICVLRLGCGWRPRYEFTDQFVSDWRGMTALSVMMLIPAIVFVALIQRQLVQGLVSGAVKG